MKWLQLACEAVHVAGEHERDVARQLLGQCVDLQRARPATERQVHRAEDDLLAVDLDAHEQAATRLTSARAAGGSRRCGRYRGSGRGCPAGRRRSPTLCRNADSSDRRAARSLGWSKKLPRRQTSFMPMTSASASRTTRAMRALLTHPSSPWPWRMLYVMNRTGSVRTLSANELEQAVLRALLAETVEEGQVESGTLEGALVDGGRDQAEAVDLLGSAVLGGPGVPERARLHAQHDAVLGAAPRRRA